jgi:hypothetical protein
MKKKAIQRGLLGIPHGITIGYLITILISLIYGYGNFHPVAPPLVEYFESVISAVVAQTFLCALIGGISAGASIIWEIDRWSLARQTGTNFAILGITLLPIAYLMHWMQRTLLGFLIYFGTFVLVFLIVWLVNYFYWKSKIKEINQQLSSKTD